MKEFKIVDKRKVEKREGKKEVSGNQDIAEKFVR